MSSPTPERLLRKRLKRDKVRKLKRKMQNSYFDVGPLTPKEVKKLYRPVKQVRVKKEGIVKKFFKGLIKI